MLTFCISVAKRRLDFLNKEGFDRFGKNKLFAPFQKWKALKEDVEHIKKAAEDFQNAYNRIKQTMDQKADIRKVLKALPDDEITLVQQQKDRLEKAKSVAEKEKSLYARVSQFCFLESLIQGLQ